MFAKLVSPMAVCTATTLSRDLQAGMDFSTCIAGRWLGFYEVDDTERARIYIKPHVAALSAFCFRRISLLWVWQNYTEKEK